jgi:hypothetical protein
MVRKRSDSGQVVAPQCRHPYGSMKRFRRSETMTNSGKTQQGTVGYVLILVIFLSIAAPAFV